MQTHARLSARHNNQNAVLTRKSENRSEQRRLSEHQSRSNRVNLRELRLVGNNVQLAVALQGVIIGKPSVQTRMGTELSDERVTVVDGVTNCRNHEAAPATALAS